VVTTAGDDVAFDWAEFVPRLVHPLKVAIVEALLWINAPLSASELTKVFYGRWELGVVSYHMKKMAAIDAISKVLERPVRGSVQTLYFFPGRDWEPGYETFERQ
jgi:hypothetical protein